MFCKERKPTSNFPVLFFLVFLRFVDRCSVSNLKPGTSFHVTAASGKVSGTMDFSAACLDGMLGGGLNSSNNANGNGHRLCRSASEMDLEQTSRDQDWRSSSSASIKMARTDSFPTLMRSSSVISDASAARMENNNNSSAASDLLESAEAAMLMRSDSPYRSCLPFYHHHQQQQPQQAGGYQYTNNNNKPSGLPLSMGRAETMNSAGMHAILAGTRSPFTPSQWQELEQQALIFKYMMAGVPVPPDLLIPLRRNINIFSSLPVAGSTLRSNLGWSSFHLGYAANNADPEPGRCRRTDGKKWRCSRDAVPDQKYCERHMNRGRHRSRKPVEGQTPHHHHSATAQSSSTSGAANNSSSASSLAAAAARSAVTATTVTTTATSATASSTSSQTNLLRSSISTHQQQQQQIGTKLSVFPASLSAGGGGVASPAASVSPFQIPLNVDRYLNGMKGDIEGPMFESSSQSINGLSMLSTMNNAWGSRNMVPAKTTSNNGMMSYETRTLIDDGGQDFGLLNQNQMSSLLSMTQNQSNDSQALQGFGAGNDEQQQRGIRHNFFDDWPRTSRDRSTAISWTEMERMRSSTSSSATKLSISIPSDFDSPGSPRCDKLMLSPLKLSMSRDADPLGIDPTTQMGLGMGMGMGMGLANQTSEVQCRQKQTNWIPITWESPVGGPLAEVLNSTKDCNVKNSALNLMTDGWDCSPRGGDSSRMASPTGVLQKTFGSLSDSSTGSSPRAVHVAKAAHDSAGLCENLRTVTFVTGASAPISTT